jgi:hypothetical protein
MRGDAMFRTQLEASSVGGLFQFKSAVRAMSPIGPKRTSLVAPHMSAFGGEADIEIYAVVAWFVVLVVL